MRYLILIVLCLFLSACPAPSIQPGGGYPSEITGIGDSSNFPLMAAGYTRGKMFMYEPGMKNHSVAYNIYEPTLQNAATLYFYELPVQIEQLFDAEKQQIIAAHPGATLVKEYQVDLQKAGVTYRAYVATFSFTDNFAQREQPLFSQLILVSPPKRFFKVRSTAPLSQAEYAQTKVLQLINAVNWVY